MVFGPQKWRNFTRRVITLLALQLNAPRISGRMGFLATPVKWVGEGVFFCARDI